MQLEVIKYVGYLLKYAGIRNNMIYSVSYVRIDCIPKSITILGSLQVF